MPRTSVARDWRWCVLASLPLALFGLAGCAKKEAGGPPPAKPAEVFYVNPVRETVTEHEEFSGRTWSPKTVSMRARVSGYLKEVKFTDGADVKAGDVLFEINPEPFQAELDRTKAVVGQAEAHLGQLKLQLERGEKLVATKSISQEELEKLRFSTAEAKATLDSAKASREIAALNLDWCTVRSPIDGRIGRKLVDPGNLVKEDDTILANIVSLNPIQAYFDFDERSIVRMRRLVEEGKLKEAPDRTRPVSISLAGEEGYSLTGRIDWIDNQVDIGTGTLRARAVIENPNSFLSPGMFVRLKVQIGPDQQSLLVPEEALGSDQGLRFVYVIGKDDKIEYRRVQIGWLEGSRRVIEGGLTAEDKVVVSGLQRIRPGAQVVGKLREPEKKEVADAEEPPKKAVVTNAP